MKQLVLAEKPSVARDIARVLGCHNKTKSYIEGKNYVVTWALGHLVSLADPEQYGKEYKTWNMDTLPMMPKQWKLTVLRKTSGQFQAVKKLIHRNDISGIIIATDAGREGELVARWILQMAGNKKPLYRLWISSVTDKAIKDGFAHLKKGQDYDNLYRAARSRAEADWLVGINATRALTCKYNAQLSCGRVQTPTLAMIAEREEEIRKFRPEKYYGWKVPALGMSFVWEGKNGNQRIFKKETAQAVGKKLKGQNITITKVQRREKKSYAPELYDLTTLQKEASKRYGFSPKQTLNLMQSLYEHHKVLTYPRTDSRYLTSDMTDTLKDRIRASSVGPYKKTTALLLRKDIKGSGRFVNDKKVSDHHAIIPTEQSVRLTEMSADERKIYDMVVRRFLAVLMDPSVSEQIQIQGEISGEHLRTRAVLQKKAGWKDAYEEQEQEENMITHLPELPEEGRQYVCGSPVITEGETKAPGRYTEGTLIDQMDKKGLGTVATRADIIDKLFRSYLLEKDGNEIKITSKGKQLLDLVPADLKKAELTADWEKKLTAISRGKQNDQKFMKEIRNYTQALIQDIKSADGTFRHDNITRQKCPECGKFLLSVNGKHGRLLVCQDRNCGYKKTVSRLTNARCPVCHKKMELVGEGENQKFVCSCGHKEKMSAFKARKEKEGNAMSRKEVNRYLKKQQKEAEAPINNAFAEALSKIKL
ncbi:MAG TPA: DNA topoisomerase III [Candidatus Anaerostipes avistercoris]|uniref:DNA topoisomerase 3 n=1 Tax=Candidatus Anaerostipes avistercoris TaxID=2838462 RepID=A0A9D2PIT1_9FIRM|nr:DNA topoisomerase III [uncultured Anaerostipes sp.]HJC51561.1 DNA topoisomerase III [Candidatus Anaerostipes avistercoris]